MAESLSQSETILSLFKRWTITTLAVALLVGCRLVDGIRYDTLQALLLATLTLSLLNLFIRPMLLLLSLPILLLTLGLFTWVINAGLLLFVGRIIDGFHVDSFGAAMWGALIISIVSVVLNVLTGGSRVKASFVRSAGTGSTTGEGGRRKLGSDDDGPVIDV